MGQHNLLEDYKGWRTATADRGESIEVSVSTEQRKIAASSLQIAFDFTKAQRGTIVGVYAGPEEAYEVGNDIVAIGLWVYGTKEALGYWLRMSLYDGKNSCKVLSLTDEKRGIDWMGWKYIKVDIPPYFVRPIKLFPRQLIRILSIKSGEPLGGPMTKGKIYIDGIKCYDTDIRLPIPPSIASIEVREIDDLVEIDISVVMTVIQARENPLQLHKTTLSIDGYMVTVENEQVIMKDEVVRIENISLSKGMHRIEVKLEDYFGNEIRREVLYEKKVGQSLQINCHYPKELPRMNKEVAIPIRGKIKEEDKRIEISLGIKPIEIVKQVEFPLGIQGKWCKRDEQILINIVLKKEIIGEDILLAELILSGIDRSIEEKIIFTGGQCLKEDAYGIWTQVVKSCEVPVRSYYKLQVGHCIVGVDSIITITDYLGNKVRGINVCLERDGESSVVGVTNEEGAIISSAITEKEGEICLKAEKQGNFSSPVSCYVYKPLLTQEPSLKMIHVGQSQHKRVMTWMTDPVCAYDTQFRLIEGNAYRLISVQSQIQAFTTSKKVSENGIVAIHQAALDVVKEGEHYQYQIGCENSWSQVYDLITHKTNKKSTNFIILGDMQSENVSIFRRVLDCIEKYRDDIHFIAQLGDLVDEATHFGQLRKILGTIENHRSGQIPWLHLLGNHELMGDSEGSIAKQYLGLPYRNTLEKKYGCYSIDYEHVHIAVISYLHKESRFEEVGRWLVEDMESSDQRWKILLTHQPPYFTNPDGGNTPFKKFFVPLIDRLGIDVVFSGHDHAYGRSFRLKNHKKVKTGTTYFVCGTVGGKHYEAVNDGSFEVYNDNHEPLYMKVKIDKKEMHICAVSIDGTMIDKVVLSKA